MAKYLSLLYYCYKNIYVASVVFLLLLTCCPLSASRSTVWATERCPQPRAATKKRWFVTSWEWKQAGLTCSQSADQPQHKNPTAVVSSSESESHHLLRKIPDHLAPTPGSSPGSTVRQQSQKIKLLPVFQIALVKRKPKRKVTGSAKSLGSCRADGNRFRCELRWYWHLHALTRCPRAKVSCLAVYTLNESWTLDWADKTNEVRAKRPQQRKWFDLHLFRTLENEGKVSQVW